MHILQVCNVGNILGGTAACAWTLTRSFPDCRHSVAFLSGITGETRRAFSGCRLLRWDTVTAGRVTGTGADVVILHNTPARRCDRRLPLPSLLYLHSRIVAAPADATVACSHWLAAEMGLSRDAVLYQAVPQPPLPAGRVFNPSESKSDVCPSCIRAHTDSSRIRCALKTKPLRRAGIDLTDGLDIRPAPLPSAGDLVVGRICTPQRRKWPAEIVPLYAELADAFPSVRWEFVGCPEPLQPPLKEACRDRATFFPASWRARSRFRTWDALLYHHPGLTESFGRTVAEAMRAGCIPVVDDRGGFREQVAPGCGFLCSDAAGFHAAVREVRSPSLRRATSRRCRRHAEREFSLRRFRQRLLRALRRVERRWACGAATAACAGLRGPFSLRPRRPCRGSP